VDAREMTCTEPPQQPQDANPDSRYVPQTQAAAILTTAPRLAGTESHRGVLVYNRTQKRDRWGQKAYTDRPTTDWIRVEAEDLRIVP
jgi:hypothetical protein